MKTLSLRTCQKILREGIHRYRKIGTTGASSLRASFETKIEALHNAILLKERETASKQAIELSNFLQGPAKKTVLEQILEFVVALLIAVSIAICVRGFWFELYEIPTGSMRPTIKEHDRALVCKNSFGINYLFATGHYNFDPSLMQRGSTVVFTVDGLDIPDPDTYYFYFFKGKKKYVKRCMAKGGDTVYFYGGKLYGIDKEGNPISAFTESPYCKGYEHIPFLSFEGREEQLPSNENDETTLIFKQMNQPIGKITLSNSPNCNPKIMRAGEWIPGTDLSSLWGLGNFAMCRLIKPEDLPKEAIDQGYNTKGALLYLELRHSPELPENAIMADFERQKQEKFFTPSYLFCRTTWIPLTQQDLDRLTKALYTCRFFVSKGYGYRYSFESYDTSGRGVLLGQTIPAGTYEFFDGSLYGITYFSYAKKENLSHPLYSNSVDLVRKLFNCGIEFSTASDPSRELAPYASKKMMALYPERYAYFDNGNLIVMGHTLFEKEAPSLKLFQELEVSRSHKNNLYAPFEDHGAPVHNGKLDIDFIKKYGLHIPEDHILALGDNHAMSGDSRVFGFVPYANIQGSAELIIWPISDRMGPIPQPEASFWRIQNAIILPIVGIVSLLSWLWIRSRTSITAYTRIKTKKRH